MTKTNTLCKATINQFAAELEDTLEIQFVHNNQEIDIFWSHSNDAWMIDVLDTQSGTPVDGGLCTGSAKDAVEFFL